MQTNKSVAEGEGIRPDRTSFLRWLWWWQKGDIQYRLTLDWARKLEYPEGRPSLRVKLIAEDVQVLGQVDPSNGGTFFRTSNSNK